MMARWDWRATGRMVLDGEHLYAVVQAGGKDTSTVDRGISVSWFVANSPENIIAKGEIKFTGWATVEAEYALAKRLAKSALTALDKNAEIG